MPFFSLILFQTHDEIIYEFDSESIMRADIDQKTFQEIQRKFNLEASYILENLNSKAEVEYTFIKEGDIQELSNFFRKKIVEILSNLTKDDVDSDFDNITNMLERLLSINKLIQLKIEYDSPLARIKVGGIDHG